MLNKQQNNWGFGLVPRLLVWQLGAEGSSRCQKQHKASEQGRKCGAEDCDEHRSFLDKHPGTRSELLSESWRTIGREAERTVG